MSCRELSLMFTHIALGTKCDYHLQGKYHRENPLKSAYLTNLVSMVVVGQNVKFDMHKYSCIFGKRNNRILVRVSVCLCVCVSVCVCVCLHDNSKRSRNTKLEYIVVYENSSDEFDIELRRTKVKVNIGVQTFSPFTTMQTVRS